MKTARLLACFLCACALGAAESSLSEKHPDDVASRRIGVYAALGFGPYDDPESFMQLRPTAPDGSPLPP